MHLSYFPAVLMYRVHGKASRRQFFLHCRYLPNRKKKKNQRNSFWITINMIHVKRRLKRCRKKNGSPVNKRQLSEQLKEMVKTAKQNYFSVILHNFLRNDPKPFWRRLNPKKEIIEQINSNGSVVTDNTTLAHSFVVFFVFFYSRVYTRSTQQ